MRGVLLYGADERPILVHRPVGFARRLEVTVVPDTEVQTAWGLMIESVYQPPHLEELPRRIFR